MQIFTLDDIAAQKLLDRVRQASRCNIQGCGRCCETLDGFLKKDGKRFGALTKNEWDNVHIGFS